MATSSLRPFFSSLEVTQTHSNMCVLFVSERKPGLNHTLLEMQHGVTNVGITYTQKTVENQSLCIETILHMSRRRIYTESENEGIIKKYTNWHDHEYIEPFSNGDQCGFWISRRNTSASSFFLLNMFFMRYRNRIM